jgi:selenide,water dikinase
VLRGLPKPTDPNLLVGTETADDAGVYRLTDSLALVQTIDFFPPVVDDPHVYGQIAAANSLSDVYAMGGRPITAMNLAGFPDNELPMSLLGQILAGGAAKCAEAGCAVVGGHTVRDKEIKFGLAVTGLVHPQEIWTNAAAKPGDALVLMKPLGTGFITTAGKKGTCPENAMQAAMMSMAALNKTPAEICKTIGGIHAVTDVTGFGLAGHVYEMAKGSHVTIELALRKLPLLPGVLELVRGKYFTRASKTNREYVAPGLRTEGQIDQELVEVFYDAQTSGGLLVSLDDSRAALLLEEAKKQNWPTAVIIGRVLSRLDKALILKND